MKQIVDYSKLPESKRDTIALQDALEWLNTRQMEALRNFVAEGGSERDFTIACSFAGFQGYPVRVLYRHYKVTAILGVQRCP